MSDSYLQPSLIEFADAINDAQQQRARGVPFLSRPRTYIAGDLPACPVCKLPTESVRVGDADEVVSFARAPVVVTCQPCGHQIQVRIDEMEMLLGHEEERQQMRERQRANCGGNTIPCPRPECGGDIHTDGWGTPVRCPQSADVEPDVDSDSGKGRPEPPSEDELNPALPVRPDPRQPAYDAVYEYLRGLGPYLPPDPVHRNAVIWRAVHAALGATPVGRCISSHCVEGDHMVPAAGEWEAP